MEKYKSMEDLHFNGLQEMYFTSIRDYAFGSLLLSNSIEDTYYNYFAKLRTNGQSLAEIWEKVKMLFPSNRMPALYISPSSDLYGRESDLLSTFVRQYTDAWMVLNDWTFFNNYELNKKISVRPVTNQEIFNNFFVETFHIAYSSDDPNDPYGQLSPTYKNSLRKSWGKNTDYLKKHFIAEYDGKPAGVITAVCYNGFVGVYNVGTISEFRHLGIGKAMMSAVASSINKNDVLFLQTEKGSLVEKWYETMGFQTVFYGECYTER